MPPLSRIQTPELDRLAEELRFASRPALLRDIDRAEALAADLDPELRYPLDWIVFRITGYRPEEGSADLVSAGALLGDLSSLVERLCHEAALGENDLEQPTVHADELAERWRVSRKTLERWRKQGLVGRRVRTPDGRVTLRFSESAAEAFASQQPALLERASEFSRIDPQAEATMLRRARRYADLLRCSRNQAADRLARRFNRSREAVRQLLRRHDERAVSAGEPAIFSDPRRLTDEDRAELQDRWCAGEEPAALVKRFGRTRGALHRVINEARLSRLRALDLGHIAPAAHELDNDQIDAALDSPLLSSLPPSPEVDDLLDLVALMEVRTAPDAQAERVRTRADHALRARAARSIAMANPLEPEARLLDRAETDLRWAFAVRAALANEHLALVLQSLEPAIGGPVSTARAPDALHAVRVGLRALGEGLDALDPWRGGRLAASVGLLVARRVAGEGSPKRDARKAQVILSRGTAAPNVSELISPWASTVRPDPRITGAIEQCASDGRRVLTSRLGLGGEHPHTLEEVAAMLATTPMHAAQIERRAIRAALGAP